MHQPSDRPGAGVADASRFEVDLPHGATLIAAIVPRDLRVAEWEQVGQAICSVKPLSPWAIGDWLLRAPRRHGKLKAAARISGRKIGTVSAYNWLSARVAPEDRRPEFGIRMHQEVATLPPERQRALLDRAASEGWTAAELRRHIRESRTS